MVIAMGLVRLRVCADIKYRVQYVLAIIDSTVPNIISPHFFDVPHGLTPFY